MYLKNVYKQEIRAFITGAMTAFQSEGESNIDIAFQKALALAKQMYNVPLSKKALEEVIEELE